VEQCVAEAAKLWGLVGVPELEWLANEARTMESIVEVGSMHGQSAYVLLSVCKGPVYCIDPWDDRNRKLYLNPPGRQLRQFMKNCGHFSNLRAITGRSPAAGRQVVEPMVDMVWIDGDHSYEAVRADVQYWHPRTAKLICGHDYSNGQCPGVKRAVDEHFGGTAQTALYRDPIWYVRIL
jgi:hypothetical protein